jgi:hypothetical protein
MKLLQPGERRKPTGAVGRPPKLTSQKEQRRVGSFGANPISSVKPAHDVRCTTLLEIFE